MEIEKKKYQRSIRKSGKELPDYKKLEFKKKVGKRWVNIDKKNGKYQALRGDECGREKRYQNASIAKHLHGDKLRNRASAVKRKDAEEIEDLNQLTFYIAKIKAMASEK
jgi:hypothetical protein